MNKITRFLLNKIAFLVVVFASIPAFSQEFIVTLGNAVMTTQEIEVDLLLTVPAGGVRLFSVSTGINFNTDILNGGTPSTSNSTTGTASWVLIPGTIAPEIMANGGLGTVVTSLGLPLTPWQLRVLQPSVSSSFADLLPGTYRVGRFRFTNTVPWASGSDPEFWLSPSNAIPRQGSTTTLVGWAPYGSSSSPLSATSTNWGGAYVTIGYTQGHPYRRSMFSEPGLGLVSNPADSSIAIAYPNPFQDDFQMKLNAGNEAVQVSVYDMLGKEIEQRKIIGTEINDLKIGASYSPGLYNIRVSQGDRTQTIRMVKQ